MRKTPLPITLAHQLVKKQAELRKLGVIPWLKPDAKSQVTVCYLNDKPMAVETVVLSTQHDEGKADEDKGQDMDGLGSVGVRSKFSS